MTRLITLILTATTFLFASIANSDNQASQLDEQDQIAISNKLAITSVIPKNIEGFTYLGYQTFPEPWGYALSYQYDKSRWIYSDVYIYPVPPTKMAFPHRDLVDGVTIQAVRDASYAKKQGNYVKYEVVDKSSFEYDGRHASRVDFFLLKNNMASYSLLFLTECEGKLIKVRMTMPDNEPNRNNKTWQKFAKEMFINIVKNIDKA